MSQYSKESSTKKLQQKSLELSMSSSGWIEVDLENGGRFCGVESSQLSLPAPKDELRIKRSSLYLQC